MIHCVFTGQMPFLTPSQQGQSTEGSLKLYAFRSIVFSFFWCSKPTVMGMSIL